MYFSIDFDQMAPGRALTLGDDALVTCLARFIHPSALIRENFPNALSTMRFTNFKVLRLERKTVSRCSQECIVFLPPTFPDVEFYAVRRYCKVTREGPIEHAFGFEEEEGGREEAELQKAHEMANNIERRGVLKDADFIEVRSEGEISIDDDNLPVP